MEPIKILMVDDHEVLRKGLRLLLNSQEDFLIVADVSSAEEAIKYVSEHPIDLLMTDITMPGVNGIELARIFSEQFPKIHVLILSMHMEEDYIVSAIDASVKGYLVKDSKEDVIFEAVRKVAKGEMYLTPNVSEVLTKSLLQSKKEQVQKEEYNLTQREKEILQCIVDGLSNKMIGPELNISERTVNAHRYNIMRKLDANNTADVVRITLNNNLLN